MTGGKNNTPEILGTNQEPENYTGVPTPEGVGNIPSQMVLAQDVEDVSLAFIVGDLINKERSAYVPVPLKRINNPGGGNCAFYAFAIGLIEIIKKERAAHGDVRSPMFERWAALDPSLANDYYTICAFDLNNLNKQRALLDRMQMGLRKVTYQYKMMELSRTCAQSRVDDGYRKLVATSSFVNFSYLFNGLKKDNDSNYNEFSNANIIAEIRKALTTPLKRISLDNALARKDINQLELKKRVGQSTLQTFLERTLNITDVDHQQAWNVLFDEASGEIKKPTAIQLLQAHISNATREEREALLEQVVKNLNSYIFNELKKQMSTLLPAPKVLGGELRIKIEDLLYGALAAEIKKHLSIGLNEDERILAEALQRKIGTEQYNALSAEIKRQVLVLSQDDNILADAMRNQLEDERYEAFSAERKKHVVALLQEDPTLLVESYENYTLAPLFLRLFYGADVDLDTTTEATPIAPNSIVPSAIQRIMQNRFWGTHLDLDYLSYPFNVNLHTLENFQQRYAFHDLLDRQTLTVNNEGNGHWTTFIAQAQKPEVRLTTNAEVLKQAETKTALVVDAEPITPPIIQPKPTTTTSQPSKPVGRRKLFKEINDVEALQRVIGDAVTRYCAYNDSIIFSFFHRHGQSGKDRAQDFLAKINAEKDFNEVKKLLIGYLENKNNGNTHPHSFRTMLLHELINVNLNCNLLETSANYDWQLVQLKKQIRLEEHAAATIVSSL
ncbi:MAG: hypothetical protein P4L79_11555 [Legionella sp.]|uniref:hypothetical protein n=1 Tax=Legionella sp. TaxID=459 RepID=UPI00284DBE43|nr:hypothetical protein [Legionella sp.]